MYTAAKAVVKIIKLERKQRTRGVLPAQSETSRKLDVALGDSLATAGNKAAATRAAFQALESLSSKGCASCAGLLWCGVR